MRIKLTDSQMHAIIYGYNEENLSMRDLARLYGVSATQIFRIVNGRQKMNPIKRRSVKLRPPDLEEIKKFLSKRGISY